MLKIKTANHTKFFYLSVDDAARIGLKAVSACNEIFSETPEYSARLVAMFEMFATRDEVTSPDAHRSVDAALEIMGDGYVIYYRKVSEKTAGLSIDYLDVAGTFGDLSEFFETVAEGFMHN